MEYVRVLHPGDFDHNTGEFNDLAFKKYGGGLSCFEVECANATSGGVCRHIAAFYANLSGDPPVFFKMTAAILPNNSEVKPTDVGNNDPCHHDVLKISNKQAKDLRHRPWAEFSICDQRGGYRPLTQADLDGWKKADNPQQQSAP